MFGFLCKTLVYKAKLVGNPTQNHLGFLQITKSFSFPSSLSSRTSFTVSYLMNSCGLSLENAITASKKVHFETQDKPDSVLRFLGSHGFTDAQIAKFVRIRPHFLLVDPENTLLPKLEFLYSIGLSAPVLSRIVSSYPSLLANSLDKHMIPTYEFIKSVVGADEKVVIVVKTTPTIFQANVQKTLAPNIHVLRNHGVPASFISKLLTHYGLSLLQQRDKFEKCVKEVIEMGFNSSAMGFIFAVQVIALTIKSTWHHKMEVYRRWDWSETEFRGAFRSFPRLMTISETKITSAMEFLVNEMGVESAVIARNPSVLSLSLEKRIIPRCSVIKVLVLKGLIKRDLSISSYLAPTEKVFLDKFVANYDKDAPELLNVYQGKMRIF